MLTKQEAIEKIKKAIPNKLIILPEERKHLSLFSGCDCGNGIDCEECDSIHQYYLYKNQFALTDCLNLDSFYLSIQWRVEHQSFVVYLKSCNPYYGHAPEHEPFLLLNTKVYLEDYKGVVEPSNGTYGREWRKPEVHIPGGLKMNISANWMRLNETLKKTSSALAVSTILGYANSIMTYDNLWNKYGKPYLNADIIVPSGEDVPTLNYGLS